MQDHTVQAEQLSDLVQTVLSLTHSTIQTGPSMTSIIFNKEMSFGAKANLKPPFAPRNEVINPALFNFKVS